MAKANQTIVEDGSNEIPAELCNFLTVGYLVENPPDLQRLSIIAYRRLAQGSSVSFEELGNLAQLSRRRIEALFNFIPESAYEIGGNGDLIGFIGLSITPTLHEITVGQRKLYTWCVFDALFLPEILGRTLILRTVCPASYDAINLTISTQGVSDAKPAAPVMSVVAPEQEACCADLRGAFCNEVNLFSNEAVFAAWAKDRRNVSTVSLDTAFALAQERNRVRFSDVNLS